MDHRQTAHQHHASDPARTFQPGHGVGREPNPAESHQETGASEYAGVTDMF